MHATATGLPPAKTVDLAWGTVDGGWVIEDYYHFRGKKYSETRTALGQFPVEVQQGIGNARQQTCLQSLEIGRSIDTEVTLSSQDGQVMDIIDGIG